MRDGVVYLGGTLGQNPVGGDEFAVLPIAAKPTHTLYLTTSAEGLYYGILRIDPNGAMYLDPGAVGDNPAWCASLGGLSFPVGS